MELKDSDTFILVYTINQVILAFWLVLAYDLLEDRHSIDIITAKFLKWRKVLKNKIITWLAEDKVQKRFIDSLNRFEKQEKVRKSRFFFREWLRKSTRTVSVGSWERLNQTQNLSCYASNLTNPINRVFVTLNYLKNSTFLNLKIVVDTDWCQEWDKIITS